MKRKISLKLILDVILTLSILTLFSKNFFGIFYHEVAGLAILIPILLHIILNIKTIRGMCKNFVKVPLNMKLCLIVDILLLLTFIWLGISGILISKTIFTSITASSAAVKIYHMFVGGLSVILLGIHIGLHICRKEMKTGIAVALTTFVFACGIYGITNSEITRWISMPFMQVSGFHFEGGREFTSHIPEGDMELEAPENNFGEKMRKGNRPGRGEGKGEGFGPEKGHGKGFGNGAGKGSMSILQKISTFLQFFGIMFSCAMITYWIVIGKKKATLKKMSE